MHLFSGLSTQMCMGPHTAGQRWGCKVKGLGQGLRVAGPNHVNNVGVIMNSGDAVTQLYIPQMFFLLGEKMSS